jgi:superfamily I DNA/RNA helicase
MILVGDDDQAIYSFSGASADAFLVPPIEPKYKEILNQSWRVPSKILERAKKLIKRVIHREPKTYHPRRDPKTGKYVEGTIIESPYTWRYPDKLMDSILADLDKGSSVMILASCAYMIEPIKALLREKALPFSNRYRRRRKDWNPLENKSTKLVSDFLAHGTDDKFWSVAQFISWADQLKVDDNLGLKKVKGRKAMLLLKDAVKEGVEGLHTTRNVLSQLLGETACQRALARDLDWFKQQLKAPYNRSLDYPLAVYNRHGINALNSQPLITIGTIHSVKGGEAHSVYLFPDTSQLGNTEYWFGGDSGHDSVLRVFYVGMTRAYEKLTLCKPSGKRMRKPETGYIEL